MKFKDIIKEELKHEQLIAEIREDLVKNGYDENKPKESYDQTVAKVMELMKKYKKALKKHGHL